MISQKQLLSAKLELSLLQLTQPYSMWYLCLYVTVFFIVFYCLILVCKLVIQIGNRFLQAIFCCLLFLYIICLYFVYCYCLLNVCLLFVYCLLIVCISLVYCFLFVDCLYLSIVCLFVTFLLLRFPPARCPHVNVVCDEIFANKWVAGWQNSLHAKLWKVGSADFL